MAQRNEADFRTGVWAIDTFAGSIARCYADMMIKKDADGGLKFAIFGYGFGQVTLYRNQSNPSIAASTGWTVRHTNAAGVEVVEAYDRVQDALYFVDAALSALIESTWKEARA